MECFNSEVFILYEFYSLLTCLFMIFFFFPQHGKDSLSVTCLSALFQGSLSGRHFHLTDNIHPAFLYHSPYLVKEGLSYPCENYSQCFLLHEVFFPIQEVNSSRLFAKGARDLTFPQQRSIYPDTLYYIYESESRSVVSGSFLPPGLYSPWNSPGQNTGVGSCSLLQRIFPIPDQTQISCIAGGFFTS